MKKLIILVLGIMSTSAFAETKPFLDPMLSDGTYLAAMSDPNGACIALGYVAYVKATASVRRYATEFPRFDRIVKKEDPFGDLVDFRETGYQTTGELDRRSVRMNKNFMWKITHMEGCRNCQLLNEPDESKQFFTLSGPATLVNDVGTPVDHLRTQVLRKITCVRP